MKIAFFPTLLLALAFTGCSKSSDDNATPNNTQLNGTKWVVTYFWDKDKDETSDFAGYSFEFKDNGVLIAYLPDGTTKDGLWSQSSSTLHFVISGTYTLDEMSDDWMVLEQTNTVLKLKDDNPTHLEALHFKRL